MCKWRIGFPCSFIGLRAKMPFIQLGSDTKNPEEEGNKRVGRVEPKP